VGTALGSFISGDLLTSMNLPAGNWAIFARVRISGDSTVEYFAECSVRLATAAKTLDALDAFETTATASANSKVIAMMALATLAADDTVELRCNDATTQPARWQAARLIAVQVTTIN